MSPRTISKRRQEKSALAGEELLLRLEGTLDVDLGLAESLRRLLGELAAAFSAEQAVLVFRDAELERLFYWRVHAGRSERIAPQSAPATRADAYLMDDLSADLAWTSLENGGQGFGWDRATGRRLARLPRLPETARQEFDLRSLLAVAFDFAGQPAGRVLLANGARRFTFADLRRLAALTGRLSRPLENLFRLRHLRARAIEAERRRISLDLHDGVLQILLSAEIQLDVVRRRLTASDAAVAEELGAVLETLRRGREELRRIVTDLRPLGVASADLEDMMRGYADRFRQESGMALDLFLDGAQLALPDRVCRELFQIYREALHNIKKHSRATHVVVRLSQDDTHARLVVDDNGQGFNFAGRFTSEELDRLRLGPISIKERTRGIGGDLTVESAPGHGARLTVELPLS